MGELAPKFSISLGSEKGNITESSFDYFPLILFNYNNTDPFSKIMVNSWEEFLSDPNFPTSTTFLFSDGVSIPSDAEEFSHSVDNFDSLGDVLSSWTSSVMTLQVKDARVTRLDCFYGKCAWPDEEVSSTFINGGSGCDKSDYALAASNYVIIDPSSANCSAAEAATAASTNSNVTGLVVISDDISKPLFSDEDIDGFNLVATSVLRRDGESLLSKLNGNQPQNIEFGYDVVNGFFLAIDASGRLQEVGWSKIPSLKMLSYAGQFLEAKSSLNEYLSSTDFLTISLFDNDVMSESASATLALPPTEELDSYNKLELEFELGCGVGAGVDGDCSVWDHCISLTADCGGSEKNLGEIGGYTGGSEKNLGEIGGYTNELGRWITTFRRRGSHFITDISNLYFLLRSDDSCVFTVQTENESWTATANLKFSKSKDDELKLPRVGVPIVFDNMMTSFTSSAYNENRTMSFTPPQGFKKASIFAVITGHGNCEFLPTEHQFLLNEGDDNDDEKIFILSSSDIAAPQYMAAGSDFGCADGFTVKGAVPNEHGTWYYGRNGKFYPVAVLLCPFFCAARSHSPFTFLLSARLVRWL